MVWTLSCSTVETAADHRDRWPPAGAANSTRTVIEFDRFRTPNCEYENWNDRRRFDTR